MNELLKKYSKERVAPVYIKGSKILLVGESAGRNEIIEGKPFVGDSGKILRYCLNKVGIDDKKVSITNVVPHKPDRNATPSVAVIEHFKGELYDFIKKVKPNIVIALGAVASYALAKETNITKIKGKVIYSKELDCKIGFTIHPAALLRTPEYAHSFLLELAKFKKESKTKELYRDREINYKVCEKLTDLTDLNEELKKVNVISIDTETTSLNPHTGKILCVGIGFGNKKAYIIPIYTVKNTFISNNEELLPVWDKELIVAFLNNILGNEKLLKVFFNAKFDLKFLISMGIKDIRNIYDVMVGMRLWNENLNPFGPIDLSYFSRMFTNKGDYEEELEKYKSSMKQNKKKISYKDIPERILYPYLAHDVDTTFLGYEFLEKKLDSKVKKLFINYLNPLLIEMSKEEFKGVKMDTEKIREVEKDLSSKLEELEKKIYDLTGEKFNIKSTKQLRDILFKKLKLPAEDKTFTGELSTSVSVLKKLSDKHDVIKYLLEYRKFDKLKNSFIDGIKGLIYNNRVYPNVNIAGTLTGRTTCSEPNIQQIPSDPPTIRQMFLPEENHYWVEVDLDRAELYMIAYYAGEEKMLKRLKEEDFHSHTAVTVGLADDVNNVSKEARKLAKNVVFGICVSGDSYVMIGSNQWEQIKNLPSSTTIFDGFGKYKAEVYYTGKKKGYKFVYKHNNKAVLVCSRDHKLLSYDGWKKKVYWVPAALIRPGMFIALSKSADLKRIITPNEMSIKGQYTELFDWVEVGRDVEKVSLTEEVEMYDLSVESPRHMYICNGFVVHNCYGATAKGLHFTLGLSVEKIEKILYNFKREYKKVQSWIEKQKQIAKRGGIVRYVSGRTRKFLPLPDNRIISKLEKKAVNTVIQGTVSDLVLFSTLRVIQRFKKENIDGRYLFFLHDATHFSINKKDVERACKIIKEEFEKPIEGTNFKIPASVKVYEKWGGKEIERKE